jgi:hypothetical protein
MNARALTVLLAWLVPVVSAAGTAPAQAKTQEDSMPSEGFVVMEHMNGRLALAVSEISGAWRREASGDQPASLRLTSPALSDAKVLTGDAADSLWRSIREGDLAPRFLLVSHMDGTLAIPRDQIRTAFFSSDGGGRLRLVYAGDPSGKVVEGDEAELVWKQLAP